MAELNTTCDPIYKLQDKKVGELKKMCKSKGVKGYTKMKKQQLIKALIVRDKEIGDMSAADRRSYEAANRLKAKKARRAARSRQERKTQKKTREDARKAMLDKAYASKRKRISQRKPAKSTLSERLAKARAAKKKKRGKSSLAAL